MRSTSRQEMPKSPVTNKDFVKLFLFDCVFYGAMLLSLVFLATALMKR